MTDAAGSPGSQHLQGPGVHLCAIDFRLTVAYCCMCCTSRVHTCAGLDLQRAFIILPGEAASQVCDRPVCIKPELLEKGENSSSAGGTLELAAVLDLDSRSS